MQRWRSFGKSILTDKAWSKLPDDWSDDEKLAGDFLAGWLEKINGHPVHRYFEPGSDEEKAAQDALCQCLWDWKNPKRPIPDAIRIRLRALWDRTHQFEDRKLTFEYRRRRQSTRAWIRALIVEAFQAERAKGRNFETAVENIAKRIGVSESTVKRALPRGQTDRGASGRRGAKNKS